MMSLAAASLNALLYARHSHNTHKYRRAFGRLPNYVEPRLHSEKIQWRKLFDRNPLFPVFSDKLAVRAYVEERAPTLKLPKTLWSGPDAREIPYASLPDRYVIKPNHRSACNYFVRSKAEVKPQLISELSRRWLRHPQGRSLAEWAYQKVQGRILVEEMLDTDPDQGHSRDYRFHVFDGRVELIVVEFAEFTGSARNVLCADSFFDRTWSPLPHRRVRDEPTKAVTVPRPRRLDDMIAAAEALGRGIDYIRADFFLVRDDIWFGEVTIYPGSGFNRYTVEESPQNPPIENLDVLMGQYWRLPQITIREQVMHGLLG